MDAPEVNLREVNAVLRDCQDPHIHYSPAPPEDRAVMGNSWWEIHGGIS